MSVTTRHVFAATCALLLSCAAQADEAVIRKAIAERLPKFPAIDEVRETSMRGLFEIRTGTDIFYTDANGNHLIEGALIDTRTKTNLTEARIDSLTAIDFSNLPLKDAIVWKQGSGARKLVVFADPNCGYCKRLERDLTNVKDVTVYTFLYPILGGDSLDKSRDIWCAKDSTKAWRDWMVGGVVPPRTAAPCDSSAVQRNTTLGRKHKVSGTPALVFENGKRVPGALPAEQLEKQFVASSGKP